MDGVTIAMIATFAGLAGLALGTLLAVYVVRWGVDPTRRLLDWRLQQVQAAVMELADRQRQP